MIRKLERRSPRAPFRCTVGGKPPRGRTKEGALPKEKKKVRKGGGRRSRGWFPSEGGGQPSKSRGRGRGRRESQSRVRIEGRRKEKKVGSKEEEDADERGRGAFVACIDNAPVIGK